ncbi:sulfurtransferase TusA family protein [Solidesulfovibrio sp.]|uniref:sulfurtransferase TusA family protein n=1 Tax=Solidesulfovibrio sp. TaxID=2910990 RepID=UPI002604A45A|nr:sulfurtransferase TusA family protein [Solidesulfovibrio sp.]
MAVHQIDITRDCCPLTYVKVKARLYALETGDVLEVLLKGGEPLENVPATAVRDGHAVLGVESRGGGIHLVRIRK